MAVQEAYTDDLLKLSKQGMVLGVHSRDSDIEEALCEELGKVCTTYVIWDIDDDLYYFEVVQIFLDGEERESLLYELCDVPHIVEEVIDTINIINETEADVGY